jgi:hypothetical protein
MKEGATRARRDGCSGPFSRVTDMDGSVSRARDRVVGISSAATADY